MTDARSRTELTDTIERQRQAINELQTPVIQV